MTSRRLQELTLRAVAFAMICGIIGYFLYVLLMFTLAIFMIGAWVFVLAAGGGPGG